MASKREEIRGVIDAFVEDKCLYPDIVCDTISTSPFLPGYCSSSEGAYKCLMKRLSELDVVIKVEIRKEQFQFESLIEEK